MVCSYRIMWQTGRRLMMATEPENYSMFSRWNVISINYVARVLLSLMDISIHYGLFKLTLLLKYACTSLAFIKQITHSPKKLLIPKRGGTQPAIMIFSVRFLFYWKIIDKAHLIRLLNLWFSSWTWYVRIYENTRWDLLRILKSFRRIT